MPRKKNNPTIPVRLGILESEVRSNRDYLEESIKENREFIKENKLNLKELQKQVFDLASKMMRGHIELRKDLGFLKKGVLILIGSFGLPLTAYLIVELVKMAL